MNYRINHDRSAAVAHDTHYRPMHTCPIATKVILLGAGGVATIGQYNGRDTFWQGWHPLPTMPKQRKQHEEQAA